MCAGSTAERLVVVGGGGGRGADENLFYFIFLTLRKI